MDRFDLAVKWDDKGVEGITAFADGFEEAEREANPMNVSRTGSTIGLLSLIVITLSGAWRPASAEDVHREIPVSTLPGLDLAAGLLEDGRLDEARSQFARIADDVTPLRLPFERGLARLGLAEVCLAGKDVAGAVAIWTKMADDKSLPAGQRTMR